MFGRANQPNTGYAPQEIVTPGKAVKAIILNGFGEGECVIERQPLGQSGQAIRVRVNTSTRSNIAVPIQMRYDIVSPGVGARRCSLVST
jgi:hypothetical protein